MDKQLDDIEKSVPADIAVAQVEHDLAEVENDYERHAVELGTVVQMTEEERIAEKKLLRKIDWHIMPLLMITFGIQYSDKSGLSSGVAFGLETATHLVGQQYSWLSTGFYISMLVFQWPVNWLMQRWRIDRVLAFCVFFWAICVFGMAACNNFEQLMAVRALLGAGEAAVTPGFLLVVGCWYRKEEQHFRSMVFFAMDAFFGLWILMIFYALGLRSTAIAGWRAIFLFLGALSTAWGFVVLFFLATPKTARWLTDDEKARAKARLVVNQQGETESGVAFNWAEARDALSDPMIWFTCAFSFVYCCAEGGTTAFASLILQSFNLTGADSIAYQLPTYFINLVAESTAAYVIYRNPNKNWTLLICIGCVSFAIIGICLQAFLDNTQKWGRIAGYWISGFYPSSIFLIWAQTGPNVAGRTKKSVAQAMVFLTFSCGYIIGPQAFNSKDAPAYRPGLYFCVACYVFLGLWLFVWRFWAKRENARRDRVVAASGLTPAEAEIEGRLNGLRGLTDRQNIHFRYKY